MPEVKKICDPETEELFYNLCRRYNIKRRPRIYVCSEVGSPVLYGYTKPTILLPDIKLSPNSLVGVLAHELTHYRRYDIWVKLACLMAESLYWFNPLVHIAAARCNGEMELSCDEAVLAGMDEDVRRSYGNVMLEIVKHCSRRRSALTTQFNPHKNAVKERILNILDMTKKKRGRVMITPALVLCIFTGTFINCDIRHDIEMPVNFQPAAEQDQDVQNELTETKDRESGKEVFTETSTQEINMPVNLEKQDIVNAVIAVVKDHITKLDTGLDGEIASNVDANLEAYLRAKENAKEEIVPKHNYHLDLSLKDYKEQDSVIYIQLSLKATWNYVDDVDSGYGKIVDVLVDKETGNMINLYDRTSSFDIMVQGDALDLSKTSAGISSEMAQTAEQTYRNSKNQQFSSAKAYKYDVPLADGSVKTITITDGYDPEVYAEFHAVQLDDTGTPNPVILHKVDGGTGIFVNRPYVLDGKSGDLIPVTPVDEVLANHVEVISHKEAWVLRISGKEYRIDKAQFADYPADMICESPRFDFIRHFYVVDDQLLCRIGIFCAGNGTGFAEESIYIRYGYDAGQMVPVEISVQKDYPTPSETIDLQNTYQLWCDGAFTVEEFMNKPGVMDSFVDRIQETTGFHLYNENFTWDYVASNDRFPFQFTITYEDGRKPKVIEALVVRYKDGTETKCVIEVNPLLYHSAYIYVSAVPSLPQDPGTAWQTYSIMMGSDYYFFDKKLTYYCHDHVQGDHYERNTLLLPEGYTNGKIYRITDTRGSLYKDMYIYVKTDQGYLRYHIQANENPDDVLSVTELTADEVDQLQKKMADENLRSYMSILAGYFHEPFASGKIQYPETILGLVYEYCFYNRDVIEGVTLEEDSFRVIIEGDVFRTVAKSLLGDDFTVSERSLVGGKYDEANDRYTTSYAKDAWGGDNDTLKIHSPITFLSDTPIDGSQNDAMLAVTAMVGVEDEVNGISIPFRPLTYTFQKVKSAGYWHHQLVSITETPFTDRTTDQDISTVLMLYSTTQYTGLHIELSLWREGHTQPCGLWGYLPGFFEEDATVETIPGDMFVSFTGAYQTYSWDGFEAKTYVYDEQERRNYSLYELYTTRSDIYTYRGIHVGSTLDEVKEAYVGELLSETVENGIITYQDPTYWGSYGPRMNFHIENDRVTAIELKYSILSV